MLSSGASTIQPAVPGLVFSHATLLTTGASHGAACAAGAPRTAANARRDPTRSARSAARRTAAAAITFLSSGTHTDISSLRTRQFDPTHRRHRRHGGRSSAAVWDSPRGTSVLHRAGCGGVDPLGETG